MTLKALANKVLQRNWKRNLSETESFHDGKVWNIKVSTKRTLFERYGSLCRWLKSYPVTAEDIKECSPELYQAIQSAITDMDNHFLNENLQGFTEAIEKVKSLYQQAMTKVNQIELTKLTTQES